MHTTAYPTHCPDGLDVAAIDALIAAVSAGLATDQAVSATSVLLDGSARQRRDRREARRAMAAVVRSLPRHRPEHPATPDDEAA